MVSLPAEGRRNNGPTSLRRDVRSDRPPDRLSEDEQRSRAHTYGLYTFETEIDPKQSSVEAANKRGALAITNSDEGIQFLRMGGNGPVDDNWGTLRVHLTPIAGEMYDRNGFYLHNSEKGFSHGCIECGKTLEGLDFFTTLLAYAHESPRKPRLKLRVKYSFPEQSTLGKTKRKPPP